MKSSIAPNIRALKLIYIANQRLPIEKAYGIQIIKMCEAFASLGLDVKLVVPKRKNPSEKNVFEYYGVKRNFSVKKISSPDFYWLGRLDKLAFAFKSSLSACLLSVYAFFKKADIVYSRDELPVFFLSFFRKNIFFEAHKFSKKRKIFYSRFKKAGIKVVVISQGLRDEFIKIGFAAENVLLAPDGVDLENFDLNLSQEDARRKVGLPLDKKIIMYTGQLFPWKGADIAAKAAEALSDHLFVFIGGVGEYLEEFKDKFGGQDNLLILGQKPHKEIPVYLKAADVLLLPNSSKEQISRSYTSPLKLFEYMASGRPIVASDLPSIREVLNGGNSILVQSNDPNSLANGIKRSLDDTGFSENISKQAFSDVQKYSWHNRAKKITEFLE